LHNVYFEVFARWSLLWLNCK